MYKQSSMTQDILKDFNERVYQVPSKKEKITKALDCLNKAAELLELSKDYKTADKIIDLISKFASKE